MYWVCYISRGTRKSRNYQRQNYIVAHRGLPVTSLTYTEMCPAFHVAIMTVFYGFPHSSNRIPSKYVKTGFLFCLT
jgi:hypothetical protein